MRLKHIKLAGFKSFVDPTKVAFPEQMTCIVGPNGCGKSNVIDAVRWVLGESSAKNLRGDAMTDVIFNGSQARKPVSQASVELVFDNTSGRVQGEFASFNEISVKRIVTRESQSLYMLNGSKCRRRDITDLFLGTGLGPRSYAIIEQGMISRLIESRPQELRVFIEEAAGISRYKERRKETESRMLRTRDNLERLADVREELGQQLAKLQRQAAAAKRYQNLKTEERELKAQLQAMRWQQYQQQCDRLEHEVQQEQAELERWVAEQRGSERGQIELREQEADLKQQVDTAQQGFYQTNTQIAKLEQQIQHERQLQVQKQRQLEALQVQQQQLDEQITADKSELEYLAEQSAALQSQLDEAAEALQMAELTREDAELAYQDWQDKWQHWRDTANQHQQQLSLAQADRASAKQLAERVEARLAAVQQELAELPNIDGAAEATITAELTMAEETLRQAEAALENGETERSAAQQQIKSIDAQIHQLQQKQQQQQGRIASLQQLLAGRNQPNEDDKWLKDHVHLGRLRELLAVPEVWLLAAETALFPWLSAPVVAAELASEIQGNAISCAPLNSGAETAEAEIKAEIKAESLAAVVLAHGHSEHSAAAAHISLLQQIAVAETPEKAAALLAENPDYFAVLQPGGVVIGRGWQLQAADQADSELLWEQQLRELISELAQTESELANLTEKLAEVEAELTENNTSIRLLRTERTDAHAAVVRLTERRSALIRDAAQQESRRQKLQDEIETLALQREEEAERLWQAESKITELEEKIAAQAPEQAARQQEGEQLQAARQQAQRQHQEQQQALHSKQLAHSQAASQQQHLQQSLARSSEQQAQLKERIADLQREGESAADTDTLEEDLAQQLMLHSEQEAELQELRERVAAVSEKLSVLNQGQSAVIEQIAKQQERVQASKLSLATARERGHSLLDALQEMNVSLKAVLQSMPEDAEETTWQQRLEDTGRKVQQLGAINLAALEEVEVQGERKAYLDAQHDDLTASLETLEDAIKKIDRETRQRFKLTYDQVNADLQQLFPKVFGGGQAYLDLTDDDLLETGVTIMARPPGKKNSTIHLLSGGEKALTALALVFAIFRLNPAPFCLLDEVDAPLDDVNVGRFCRLVQEMSESVQFIYISHNKIAMEMATHLAGVTMQEPGVSRLVAVDVEEALALAEA
ncbi:chromosome segregation protein SMC [Aliidiomarina iranensis]|uniref:Chromosome partition protein Smc n=1 Tax=Aliidiomarina iranensis TaxID=1434071 RepID=A0A432W0U4_9GAMM|nr:chromosome segregation protein SMC [Aliidiomarina iranensis]RUO22644.1 chromosome segregation protein SMC [Aliidiomarina iranensis]